MSLIPGLGIIIVAGGSSSRYGKGNKLLEDLAGLPVFLHSVKNFSPLVEEGKLILVTPAAEMETFRRLCAAHLPEREIVFVSGGASRTASVKNGLAALPEDTEIVAIHDAARPLAPAELMCSLAGIAAEKNCGVIAAQKVTDSICSADMTNVITANIPRENLWQIQTPQVFPFAELCRAYTDAAEDGLLTDDSVVARSAGLPVLVFDNPFFNIKLTYADELSLLEYLLKNASKSL